MASLFRAIVSHQTVSACTRALPACQYPARHPRRLPLDLLILGGQRLLDLGPCDEDVKKGTGHLLLAKCLNLRRDGNDYCLETHISHCAVYWAVGGVILLPSRPLNREGCTQKAFVWVSLHRIGSSSTISLWEPRRIGGPQMPVPVETFRNAPPFACRPLRYG